VSQSGPVASAGLRWGRFLPGSGGGLVVPVVVSVLVHAGVIAGLAVGVGTWTFGDEEPAGEPAAGGVVINLEPIAERARPAAAAAEIAPPAAAPARAAGGARGAGVRSEIVPAAPATPVPERAAAPAPSRGTSTIAGALAGGDAAIGVAFAGLSAQRTRSVVYVVDASGPMVTTLPQVLALLTRSVGDLLPTQRFSVVLFRDSGGSPTGAEVFSPRLLDATPRNQARLKDWLAGVRPGGRSNPLAGLRAALALKPQVVFLLTRSIERSGGGQWEQGLAGILSELESLNPVDPATGRRRTAIKTIQFLEDDPTGIMSAIADRHGGPGESRAVGGEALEPGYRVLRPEELPK
jgi:hypothetical protein